MSNGTHNATGRRNPHHASDMGVQIVELVSGNGAVDSGDMSVADVAAMFGSTDGFKADSPAVRPADSPVAVAPTEDSYNF